MDQSRVDHGNAIGNGYSTRVQYRKKVSSTSAGMGWSASSRNRVVVCWPSIRSVPPQHCKPPSYLKRPVIYYESATNRKRLNLNRKDP